MIITFTLIGMTAVYPVFSAEYGILEAIFMTILGAGSLVFSLVSGFSNGDHSIRVVSTGVYKTANEFIEKANGYCTKEKKFLYYKQMPEGWLDKIKREAQEKLKPVESPVEQVGITIEDLPLMTLAVKSEDKNEEIKLEVD
jgi:hypothetical protein